MKRYPTLCVLIMLFLLISTASTIIPVQAQIIEKDVGIPFYPGSKQIHDCVPLSVGNGQQSFQNITLIAPDGFTKVLFYYQEKLGKFSISGSQTSTKSAMWNKSTPKGYQIVTLVESQEGTKITITKRIW